MARFQARRWLLVGLVLSAAGCGNQEPLTVSEALAASGEHPVSGHLVVTGESVRLCQALAESFPPQCGEASIEIRGLDLLDIPDLQTVQGVSWTDRPVTLSGVLGSGSLDGARLVT